MAERNGGFSTIAAEWAQVISALVGAIAAAVAVMATYQSMEVGKRQNDDAKTLQTLQFFATFNSQDMLGIRHKISNEDWCVRYLYNNNPADREAYSNYPPETHPSPEEIYMVVDFFDALDNSCNQSLCNQNFTLTLFRPYAQDMYEKLAKFIIDARHGGRADTFGKGMADLAQNTAPIQDVAESYRKNEPC
jgi:hypothetical protein